MPNLKFKKVIGHGMNIQELEANKRLDSFWNQDLNKNQILPLENSSVDYCLIVAGWQYLQFPELVSSEILRVLKPHGKFIISFSNRAFWNKSPNIWVNSDDQGRIDYISRVLKSVGWKIDSVIAEYLKGQSLFSLFKSQSDPFFSVIATKPSDL
ncbi:class I SAM-dependent methyltransferase [Prochlorococcus sp. MIT 1223]|uniref:class I SAM-dependent methyltransferase n=1 Tax=Prochlorococcus sp. MIT 1223 TaxID=3096217 RepID=UPI002A7536C1|nr:methyltransferase domain-containing protein [Prochlorococcus sp. MIT 1223]